MSDSSAVATATVRHPHAHNTLEESKAAEAPTGPGHNNNNNNVPVLLSANGVPMPAGTSIVINTSFAPPPNPLFKGANNTTTGIAGPAASISLPLASVTTTASGGSATPPAPGGVTSASVMWSSPLSPRGVATTLQPPVASEAADKVASSAVSPSPQDQEEGGNNKTRRQKRLERNRESARLSRRRRKQYLEVLEERVSQLSHEMDEGRREHVAQAVTTVRKKREQQPIPPSPSIHLIIPLRSSSQLQVAATFRAQQLASFCSPPSDKFVLWLTLQNEEYFRGGRAASERLSAARIGERMLQQNHANHPKGKHPPGVASTPSQPTMWPLLCHEIGLSYDQEEKVRNFQRALLQAPESWLSRHSAFSVTRAMEAAHNALQALAQAAGRREQRNHSIMGAPTTTTANALLRPEQRSKLSSFVASKRQQIQDRLEGHSKKQEESKSDDNNNSRTFELSKSQHVAANLYILNHRLSKLLNSVPPSTPLVTGPALKKLSRRPSFESLGARSGEKTNDQPPPLPPPPSPGRPLNRDTSFCSTGSLKRSASEMSMEDNGDQGQQQYHHRPAGVDPVEAQANAMPVVEEHLGHVKEIIPVSTVVVANAEAAKTTPPSPMVTSVTESSAEQQHASVPGLPDAAMADDDGMILDPMVMMNLPDPVPVSVMSSTPPPAAMAPPPASLMFAPPPSSAVDSSSLLPLSQSDGALLMPTMLQQPHQQQPAISSSVPQRRSTSFLPASSLGVVPEEMWSAEAAEDFLMTFVDGNDADDDWAIGQGVETDM